VLRAIRTAGVGFRAHRGLFLASGLSFTFLMCLIPVLFILVSLAGFVLNRRAATEVVVNHLAQYAPVYRSELHQILGEIVRRRGLSGLLGTAVLLLFASQLFGAFRLVLNDVFDFRSGPGFLREFAKDLLLLFVMGALFLVSIVITDLVAWLKVFLMVPVGMPPEWIRSVFITLALVINTVMFFIAYRYFPHRKVPVGAALAGGLLASVLWEAAKQLFRWYILSVGVYDKIYGPLGGLVALSMFTYYSGVVFVLGAEFAAALRAGRRPPA
jgi:membrane protein